jgi:hypothetical protein
MSLEPDALLSAALEAELAGNPLYQEFKGRPIGQTLCIIKPDAMDKAEEIMNVIKREGLAILQVTTITLLIKF